MPDQNLFWLRIELLFQLLNVCVEASACLVQQNPQIREYKLTKNTHEPVANDQWLSKAQHDKGNFERRRWGIDITKTARGRNAAQALSITKSYESKLYTGISPETR